ncbi:MAG: hypothetical protein JNL74_04595 [Fibrobacteres bacterium]|nr:hypothetical protein [Fibrobacterota bacterium]
MCVRKVDLKNYGSNLFRFGDLNGDGEHDALYVQGSFSYGPSCLTAITLDGTILWQNGVPGSGGNYFTQDIGVEIYDIDGDGNNEVLYLSGAPYRIHILNGKTGTEKKSAPVGSNNAIIIANLAGSSFPRDILIKDEYKNLWAYDSNFTLLWHKSFNTGHYPLPIDFDGDGKDEVMAGHRLINSDGSYRWADTSWNRVFDTTYYSAFDDYPYHADAIDIDDMDGDGVLEIAIATSKPGALVSPTGQAILSQNMTHAQHACIGAFSDSLPGKQVAFVDRVGTGGGGYVSCYTKDGTQLFRTSMQGWLTMASTVDGWTADTNRSYLLVYRRIGYPPVLIDGKGKQVAEFSFPSGWEVMIQHFDVLGDTREEILISNKTDLWVYTNGEPAPGLTVPTKRPQIKRIYNATAYIGMQ